MTESQRHLKVFLSYASQDRTIVSELSRRLVDEGWIDPWVDEKKLLPGQDWRTKIEEAVETSDAVIICLSNNSVTKEGFVQKELRYAREISFEKPDNTIFLIPLRLDECEVPRGLRFFQWVDFFGKNKDKSYEALVESLKLRYEQKLQLEEAERVREEKERKEREVAERAEREQAEREALERAAREKLEREVWEKATRESLEREAAEKLAQEKAKRDEIEKIKREKAERQVARRAEIARFFSRMLPFTKIFFLIGSVVGLFWVVSWAIPKFLPPIPTVESTATLKQQVEPSPMPASPTIELVSSPTLLLIPSVTNTPAIVDERSFRIEHLETITIENLPKLTQLAQFTYDGTFLGISPSGKTIITNTGVVYNLETQQIICDVSQKVIDEQRGWEFALSENYAIVSSDIGDNDQIWVWDLRDCTSKEIKIPSIIHVGDVAISPNEVDSLFAAGNLDNRSVLIHWDLDTNEQKKKVTLGASVSDITFSSDGVTFVVSTGGGFAQVYTLSDFTLGSKYAASNLWANIISYRPDKDILITSDEYPTTNTNIRIWKIPDGRILYRIPDTTEISSGRLGLSPDGRIYVASNEKTLSFWDINANSEAYELELERLLFGASFSDSQKILLFLLDGNRMAMYGINSDS